MDVVNLGAREEPLDHRLNPSIRDVLLGVELSATPISIERERVASELVREGGVLRISGAHILVDENGTGQRQVLPSREGIIGERMRRSAPTWNVRRQSRQGPYPFATSAKVGWAAKGDVRLVRTVAAIASGMARMR